MEDVFVLIIIKMNYILSQVTYFLIEQKRLKESIERKIEDLKHTFSVEDINYKSIPRHITTNISEQQFVQTIRILKRNY